MKGKNIPYHITVCFCLLLSGGRVKKKSRKKKVGAQKCATRLFFIDETNYIRVKFLGKGGLGKRVFVRDPDSGSKSG